MATKQRYTISKEIAENLQLGGWTLKGKFYDDDYKTDIYHLETEVEGEPSEKEE